MSWEAYSVCLIDNKRTPCPKALWGGYHDFAVTDHLMASLSSFTNKEEETKYRRDLSLKATLADTGKAEIKRSL